MSVTDSSEFKFRELNYFCNDAEYDCLNFKFEIILIDNRYNNWSNILQNDNSYKY